MPLHHKDRGQKEKIPITKTAEGTSKRNIHRKGSKGDMGHGQKGKWDPTNDGSVGTVPLMPGDPNYDPDELNDKYILVSDGLVFETMTPDLSLSDFKQKLNTIFEEYFLSEDVSEAIRSIEELKCPAYHYEIVKKGINMSLDKKDHERELISKILSEAYPKLFDSKEIGKGFQRLFEMIDDIQLDAPSARTYVSSFLARAIVDEILPPSFLRNNEIVSIGGDIVKGATNLLSRDHVLSRVERVWGPGDGRSVSELKVAIDQLLEEYLLSRQMEEAIHCVKELNCPHFYHEVVRRAVKQAIDKTEDDCTAMSKFISECHTLEVISTAQVAMGFDKLFETLPDMKLDVPSAEIVLKKFVQQAIKDGCLSSSYQPPPQSNNNVLQCSVDIQIDQSQG
mmetsp:Transcript_19420/g.28774  ORF Transcript_19420/g.28774 Transcript_19420/m.28774 type:complete len:394 (+) Transcript_19420:52-1233(+)|eukprot:CAMPEP_0171455368 /NCGR_PEP_ID=MMETSP0945-20130129/2291_1 /TAXON_ID=109269 /ORGANISM="Vaucheria litorea, Strain CCMP2940" /LENGTH=393 /DNA_ID=CAMNT_0011980595 /DNA_START=51 /DNA_END=1232 /DNA_ORIENTATION=-